MRRLLVIYSVLLVAGLLVVACGGGSGGDSGDGAADGAADDTPSAVGVSVLTPRPSAEEIVPPFEGPPRRQVFDERTNYRRVMDFRLPAPEALPEPPMDAEGAEFSPPAAAACPQGWERLVRTVEKFQICYPPTWRVEGEGDVSAGFDDRWYSLGLFNFEGDRQLAHVSIYRMNAYAQPFLYTRGCERAYRVSLSGQPAALCPDFPGSFTEGKIIAYHVRVDDLDYFVNAVVYLDFDEEKGEYVASWPQELEEEAIEVAQTFELIGLPDEAAE